MRKTGRTIKTGKDIRSGMKETDHSLKPGEFVLPNDRGIMMMKVEVKGKVE
jgi:hypothetical protein